jgi:hypothetical protein
LKYGAHLSYTFAMQSTSDIVHDIANALTENDTLEDAMHALYIRTKLHRSAQIAEAGGVTSQAEMETRYLNDNR